jgi:hypothetical protein
MECVKCQLEIPQENLKMSACGHPYHISCFMVEIASRYVTDSYYECVECQQLLLDNADDFIQQITARVHQLISIGDETDEEEQDDGVSQAGSHSTTHSTPTYKLRYKQLHKTSPKFRTDVKNLKTTIKELNRLKKEAAPIVKQKEADYKEKTKPLLDSIKSLTTMIKMTRKTIRKECKSHSVVKQAFKKKSSLNRQYYAMQRKWELIALRNCIPGVRARYYSPLCGIARRIRFPSRYI